jgi:RNA polymerase sigma-54 factor
MKQGLKQLPKQTLALTPLLQNQIGLLSLSGNEIRKSLNQVVKEYCEESRSKEYLLFKDLVFEDRFINFLETRNQPQEYQKEIPQEKDIKATLLDQLYIENLEEYEILIGEYLIDSINKDGRLDNNLDYKDISLFVYESLNFKVGKKEIKKILFIIQNFEPVGCAYRTVLESLLIQTDHLEIRNEEKKIIKRFLQDFSKEKIDVSNLSPQIKKVLQKLKFNPCIQLNLDEVSYVRPDLVAIENSNKLEVTLNDPFLIESLTQKIKTFVKSSSSKKKKEALSFINGFERRQKTLLEVGKFIVSKQEKHLLDSKALTPLTLKQIATFIGISESTVSRIVKSKYLQLPKKNIPLSSLLEKKVTLRSSEGKEVSPSQLKKLIKTIIQIENKSEPFSDQRIQKFLKEKYKVSVARRTVAKYRQEAHILPSRQRT